MNVEELNELERAQDALTKIITMCKMYRFRQKDPEILTMSADIELVANYGLKGKETK